MGRGKVNLRLIENQSLRNSTYRKRLRGLKKKAYEISTLCDVPATVISIDSDGTVDTFPENKEEVCAILMKYNSNSNKVAEKYKQNSESMTQSLILKKQLELNQLREDNHNIASVTSKYLDSILVEVQKRIMFQSYGRDIVLEEELESSVDVGKFNGEKEYEEVEVGLAIEESHCSEHGDLPNSFGVEESIIGIDSSFDDINGMQIATEEAGCHKHGGEFSTDDLLRGSNSSLNDTNDLQIITHLAKQESDQSNVFSSNLNEFSEHVSDASCYVDDDPPYLFELSDFMQF